ncbi:MAG: hypothetical protein IPP87_04535 [Ideonella sp.]|nr:hypothetical protein [Ideonella sp.]MBL0148024.1 hypothetical protein [Ideonella sp.]
MQTFAMGSPAIVSRVSSVALLQVNAGVHEATRFGVRDRCRPGRPLRQLRRRG